MGESKLAVHCQGTNGECGFMFVLCSLDRLAMPRVLQVARLHENATASQMDAKARMCGPLRCACYYSNVAIGLDVHMWPIEKPGVSYTPLRGIGPRKTNEMALKATKRKHKCASSSPSSR